MGIPMLDKIKTLLNYKLCTVNGDIGKVKEFYFDDQHWAIRYLAADTGRWLPERQVLISPYALERVSRERHRIVLALTNSEIESSPCLPSDQPVSHQFEEAYYGFHGWPKYWCGPYTWGFDPHIVRDRTKWNTHATEENAWGRNVRRTSDVTGYYIQATDGEIGHVDDFIVDDETWAIRYLIVSTRNWWPGKRVLVSPQWLQSVTWGEGEMFIKLSGETIHDAPEYTEKLLVTRDYEDRLHRYYERIGYWTDRPGAPEQLQ